MDAKAIRLRLIMELKLTVICVPHRLSNAAGQMNISCGYQEFRVFLLYLHDSVKRVIRLLQRLVMPSEMH
jgi:hypothetical protein